MPALALNTDGTINQDRLAYETLRDSQSSSKNGKADTSDLDKQIAIYEKAMSEASGFKRRELAARLEEAKQERESRIEAAKISAKASNYGADRGLEGTKYSSDNSLKGTQYASDNSLKGTQYASDKTAASSRYGTDADLYKFNSEMPLKRGEQALSFLNQYNQMAERPSSFLQASNYQRLGQQVEGMPMMLRDLLGNVNPNGQPAGGNIAFRTGTSDMPLNAAEATWGTDPLHQGTRGPSPDMPTWSGGNDPSYTQPPGTSWNSQYTSAVGGATDAQAGMPSSTGYGQQQQGGGMLSQAFSAAGGDAYATGPQQQYGQQYGQQAQAGYGAQAGMPASMTYGQQQPYALQTDFQGQQAPYAGQGDYQAQQPAAPQQMQQANYQAQQSYGAQGGDYQAQQQPAQGGNYQAQQPSQGTARPNNYNAQTGQISNPDAKNEERFKGGVKTLMQRGAHQWGNQALEKMTSTERDMMASGIKANGGVPGDFFEAYARSRIGNEGSGRSL